MDLAVKIAATSRLLRGLLARCGARHGVGEADFSLLWICRNSPVEGAAQHRLAATLGVSPAHVSGLVERLRQRGLLSGHRAAADRRCQVWRPTPAGTALVNGVLADFVANTRQWADCLSTSDQEALAALVDRLLEALGKRPELNQTLKLFIPEPNDGDAVAETEGGEA